MHKYVQEATTGQRTESKIARRTMKEERQSQNPHPDGLAKSIPSLLFETSRKYPEQPFLQSEKNLSYREFYGQVLQRSEELSVEQSHPCIAILLENGAELVLNYFAGLLRGTVALIDPRISALEQAECLMEVQPSLLITSSELKRRLDPVSSRLKSWKTYLVDGPSELPREKKRLFEDKDATDIALIVISPGTEKRKILYYSAESLYAAAGALHAALNLETGDCMVPVGSLSALQMQTAVLLAPIFAGASVCPGLSHVSSSRGRPIAVLEAGHVATIVGQGQTLSGGKSGDPQAPLNLPSGIRFSLCFGDFVDLECRNLYERQSGAPLRASYGQVEAGGLVALESEEGKMIPLPGVQIRVSEDGSIELLSSFSASGAASNAASDGILPGRWLPSGDVGQMENGSLQILGRASEVVHRANTPVYPMEIERALRKHPDVLQAAAIGLPDADLGEELVGLVLLKGSASAEERSIKDFLRGILAPEQLPGRIEILRSLPHNAQGKLLRNQLRRDLQSRQKVLNKVPGTVDIDYGWVYGKALSRFYAGLKEEEKIYGTLCPSCWRIQVPPKIYCGVCFVECNEYVEVPRTGVLESFTTVYLEYPGQPKKPPYTYGYVKLDGSHTHLYHLVEGADLDSIHTGMRVEAVFKPQQEREGTLYDIKFFQPTSESS